MPIKNKNKVFYPLNQEKKMKMSFSLEPDLLFGEFRRKQISSENQKSKLPQLQMSRSNNFNRYFQMPKKSPRLHLMTHRTHHSLPDHLQLSGKKSKLSIATFSMAPAKWTDEFRPSQPLT